MLPPTRPRVLLLPNLPRAVYGSVTLVPILYGCPFLMNAVPGHRLVQGVITLPFEECNLSTQLTPLLSTLLGLQTHLLGFETATIPVFNLAVPAVVF